MVNGDIPCFAERSWLSSRVFVWTVDQNSRQATLLFFQVFNGQINVGLMGEEHQIRNLNIIIERDNRRKLNVSLYCECTIKCYRAYQYSSYSISKNGKENRFKISQRSFNIPTMILLPR